MSEPNKKTKDQIQDDRLNDHWDKIEALEKKVQDLGEATFRDLAKPHTEALRLINEQIAEIIKKLTWLSDENAKLYTQVDDDALKRAKLEEVLRDDYKFKIENLPDNELKKHYEGLLEKLDSPKKKCEHKDMSSSSDPLIWYICHDCGAHLNQAFEEISPKTYALHKKVLEDSGGEKELPNRETVFYEASYGINGKPNVPSSKLPEPIRSSELSNKLDDEGVEMETVLQTEPENSMLCYVCEAKIFEVGGIEIALCLDCYNKDIDRSIKESKELIEEFLERLKGLKYKLEDYPITEADIDDLIEEYEGRIK